MLQLGVYRTALIVACGLVAACAERPSPAPPAAAPAAKKQIYVFVQRGQSLDQLAQTYRVAKDDIIAANQLKPPYSLKPGTVLTIPAAIAEPALPQAAARPDRAISSPTPRRRTKPNASGKAVIPLDDPVPTQLGTSKSSTPPVAASSDAVGPRVSFPEAAPEADKRPTKP
jgi:LysM repeat protein